MMWKSIGLQCSKIYCNFQKYINKRGGVSCPCVGALMGFATVRVLLRGAGCGVLLMKPTPHATNCAGERYDKRIDYGKIATAHCG